VNALPMFAVFGWSAFALMLLYWLENTVIGVVNLLKIIVASIASPARRDFRGLLIGAVWIALLHFLGFVVYWVIPGEWRQSDPMSQMFEPYGRIIVLHMVLIVATVPVLLLSAPLIGVLVLALLKTFVELGWWQIDTGSRSRTCACGARRVHEETELAQQRYVVRIRRRPESRSAALRPA
jgi:hypothetical protein